MAAGADCPGRGVRPGDGDLDHVGQRGLNGGIRPLPCVAAVGRDDDTPAAPHLVADPAAGSFVGGAGGGVFPEEAQPALHDNDATE
jgi:hypothetical protein